MAADLHMLLIYGLKFNLSSNWILKSSTEATVLIYILSITTFSFVWSLFFLSIIITWNLSGFTIICFFLKQSVITADSLAKYWLTLIHFQQKQTTCCHLQNYVPSLLIWTRISHLLISWTKEDPVQSPEGHP